LGGFVIWYNNICSIYDCINLQARKGHMGFGFRDAVQTQIIVELC